MPKKYLIGVGIVVALVLGLRGFGQLYFSRYLGLGSCPSGSWLFDQGRRFSGYEVLPMPNCLPTFPFPDLTTNYLTKDDVMRRQVGEALPIEVEIRDFSCAGMTGFTFKYPVFKGWEPRSNGGLTTKSDKVSVCEIPLNRPDGILFEIPSVITVRKQPYGKDDFEIPAEAVSNLNPDGIMHRHVNDEISGTFEVFYAPGFKVYIEVQSVSTENGFSTQQFFQTVIDSFRLLKY